MLSYLNKAMQTDFPDLDSPKYEVKYVPTSMEEFSSPAFYLTPPADTLSPNTIYINRSSQVNPAELFTTLAMKAFRDTSIKLYIMEIKSCSYPKSTRMQWLY